MSVGTAVGVEDGDDDDVTVGVNVLDGDVVGDDEGENDTVGDAVGSLVGDLVTSGRNGRNSIVLPRLTTLYPIRSKLAQSTSCLSSSGLWFL